MKQQLLIKQDLKQRQGFYSTRKQSLHILQMNAQDLQMYLRDYSNTNPFFMMSSNTETDIFDFYTAKESLSDVLKEQLRYEKVVPKEEIVDYLLSMLNSNGYFKENLETIVKGSIYNKKEVVNTIHILQRLEPIGCFCFSLKESLQVQCEMNEDACSETGYILCDYLEELALRKFNYIEEKTELPYDEIWEGFSFIQTLNPKPASNYATQSNVMIPEIRVKIEEEKIVLETIEDMFRLELDEDLSIMHEQLKKQRQEAQFIMNSVQKRKMTIFQIMEILVEKQKDFFLKGKPLKYCTLQEVANASGLHVSTISRAIQNKSFEFHNRYYPMKYLLVRSGVQGYNDVEIKKYIKEFIKNENKKRPYSDDKIRKKLEEKNIFISRRTVAKYREDCLIFNAAQRKQREEKL